MALQTSGAISLNDIHVEAGGSSGTQASINDSDIRGLINKASGAQMSFSEWYGASSETVLTSAGNVNGQAQRKQISASSFISSGGTLRIPSNIWVWSDSTSTAALTIDISCTIINEGKIIGRGGNGNGGSGGPAIKINSGVSGVTIQNASGAFIGGGGGGGSDGGGPALGGGGGAGGGTGGSSNAGGGGAGGSLNAAGSTGSSTGSGTGGAGGNQGGQGGARSNSNGAASGGGGGRVAFGSSSTGGAAINENGGDGGGWGASGGSTTYYGGPQGGSGGAAINDSGNSYTLSNSGTIYGAT